MSMSHQHSDACCRYRLPIGQRVTANPNIEAAAALILTQSYKWVRGQSSWEHASDQQKEAATIGATLVVAAALTRPGDTETDDG